VREHDALGLAGGAGGVDERSELARKNLRSAHTVRGDVCRASAGNKGFVAETFAGNVGTAIGDNYLFELGEIGTDGEKLLQLGHANDQDNLGAAVIQDVGHTVGRFVEVHRHGDSTGARYSEIGGMPLGAVGGEKAHAVAGLYAEFNKGGRQASDAAEKFLGRDGLPTTVTANHLCAGVRKIIDGIQEA